MGILVYLKDHRHGRASTTDSDGSAGSRAAKSARISGVTPFVRARSVDTIGAHHFAGIRLRCAHLRALQTGAPISVASAAGEGQSAMIARNEVSSVMPHVLGQAVLKSKAKMSHDFARELLNIPAMPDRMSETEEKLAFIRRVRVARETRFPEGQKPMYRILEIDQGTYKQYETRTPLPHRFIPKFCYATGVSLEWLLTGEGKGPNVTELPAKVEKRTKTARRGKAARAA